MSLLHITSSVAGRTYGVLLEFDEQLHIHFEMELERTEELDGYFYMTLNKKQVYINSAAPELIIDKLADDLGKLIYPLVLQVSPEGYFIGVANHEEIQNRWRQGKESIARYYQGPVADRMIQNMEQVIDDKTELNAMLQQDWFIAVFFSGIYGLKAYDFKQYTECCLPVLSFLPSVRYKIKREITEQHTANKCFTIACSGVLAEERSAEDIRQGHPVALHRMLHGTGTDAGGTLHLSYRLYHSDFAIRSVTGACSLQLDEGNTRKVKFEIYHLQDQEMATG